MEGGKQYTRRKRTSLKGPLVLASSSANGCSSDNVFGGRLGLGGWRDQGPGRNSDRTKGGGRIMEEEEKEEQKVVSIDYEEGADEYNDGDDEYEDGDEGEDGDSDT